MFENSSSDAASVLGGKNSKLNVVGWDSKMSWMCMACSSLKLLDRVHGTRAGFHGAGLVDLTHPVRDETGRAKIRNRILIHPGKGESIPPL
jgi:hypothetical protein